MFSAVMEITMFVMHNSILHILNHKRIVDTYNILGLIAETLYGDITPS